MKFILGKKMAMTQLWKDDKVLAVTPVKAGPCTVSQVKTAEKDSYQGVQIAFGSKKDKHTNKPQQGHFKKIGFNAAHVREFRTEQELSLGDKIRVNTFEAGDIIDVTGTSKGRGFQGVVKRHGFAGGDKSHGNKDQLRMPGSIGATGPAHVFKGMRMPGRMGGERVTVKNLEIAEVDSENDILYIRGAVPGAIGGLLLIKGDGELRVNLEDKKEEKEEEEVKEEDNASEVTNDEVKEEKKEEPKVEEKPEPVAQEKKEEKVEDKKVEDKKEEVKEEAEEEKKEEAAQ